MHAAFDVNLPSYAGHSIASFHGESQIEALIDQKFSCEIRLPGDHDGGTRTAQLRQIAARGHAYAQPWSLTANDRTIAVGLEERVLQAPPPCASAVARLAELALIAGFRKCACLPPKRSAP